MGKQKIFSPWKDFFLYSPDIVVRRHFSLWIHPNCWLRSGVLGRELKSFLNLKFDPILFCFHNGGCFCLSRITLFFSVFWLVSIKNWVSLVFFFLYLSFPPPSLPTSLGQKLWVINLCFAASKHGKNVGREGEGKVRNKRRRGVWRIWNSQLFESFIVCATFCDRCFWKFTPLWNRFFNRLTIFSAWYTI